MSWSKACGRNCRRRKNAEISESLYGDPSIVQAGSYVKVGKFVHGTVEYHDDLDGSLISTADKIMDLIDGYPAKEVAYIGFFMMNPKYQGKRIG